MTAMQPRPNNTLYILVIGLLVMVLILTAVMVWHIATDTQPSIRPQIAPKKAPALPGAWYERFGKPEAMKNPAVSGVCV